jgi:hypothetical protein
LKPAEHLALIVEHCEPASRLSSSMALIAVHAYEACHDERCYCHELKEAHGKSYSGGEKLTP